MKSSINSTYANKFLRELLDESPWMDVNTYNICKYCDYSWTHRVDCFYVRLREAFNNPVPLTELKDY